MAELMQSIGRYWTRRAPSYTDVIKKNLADGWDKVWADELTAHFPRDTRRVLDIGTGPGFFAMILARRGYAVTAVDYSDGMLREARRNAGDLARHIRFARMDAQRLDLTDGSFDAGPGGRVPGVDAGAAARRRAGEFRRQLVCLSV